MVKQGAPAGPAQPHAAAFPTQRRALTPARRHANGSSWANIGVRERSSLSASRRTLVTEGPFSRSFRDLYDVPQESAEVCSLRMFSWNLTWNLTSRESAQRYRSSAATSIFFWNSNAQTLRMKLCVKKKSFYSFSPCFLFFRADALRIS